LPGPAQLVLQCRDFLLGVFERLLQQQRTLHQKIRRIRLLGGRPVDHRVRLRVFYDATHLDQLIQKILKNLPLLRTHGQTPLKDEEGASVTMLVRDRLFQVLKSDLPRPIGVGSGEPSGDL
jgi:hypothetical protein